MDLREYESVKFELAEILRAIAAAVPKEASALHDRITDLFARLAEDRFNLAVVGRFSRGKTSLMNAILGLDRLPTGILPLTSVITSVAYGTREEVRIQPERHGFEFEIQMAALEEYITERGNPGNARAVRMAKIALPAEILRRGFRFVDTPGLGSAIVENARTTEAFLPETDAVIMVSGYDGPLTDEELAVARALLDSGRRMFFVLNKHDIVEEAARTEVQQYVSQRLAEADGEKMPPVFSVSAREGLLAKQSGDLERLAASGVTELESALVRFLIEEKNEAFLCGMCDRAGEILSALGARGADRGLTATVEALRARLSQVEASHGPETLATRPLMRAPRHVAPSRMTECALCARVSDALFDFLRHYQHDLATQPYARTSLAQGGGLCGPHLWLYASLASQRDLCLVLTPLMKQVSAAMQASVVRSSDSQVSGAEQAVPVTGAACVVCKTQSEAESHALAKLSDTCAERMRSAEQDLPSLCLPHLRAVAQRLTDQTLVETLIKRQSAATDRLIEDMQRYVLKRDGIRRALTTEEETQAAQTAIAFLAGRRNVMPDRCRR